jgi:hypothetical protein
MGKHNKARRAAKAKARRRQQGGGPGGRHRSWGRSPFDGAGPDARDLVAGLLGLAVDAYRRHDGEALELVGRRLGAFDRLLVDAEIERGLLRLVAAVWDGGWQPLELARQVRRTAGAAGARLALWAIDADHSQRDHATLDPRWAAQLEQLELPGAGGGTGWLAGWQAAEGPERSEALRVSLEVVGALGVLGPLQRLIPPPGGPLDEPVLDRRAAGSPVLDRVRALLAQAESTTFPAEAEAFTAKAQELIARHAIDSALLAARGTGSGRPVTVRVPIDDPYADAKSLLAQVVSEHCRCRAVFHPSYSLTSVVGFADDVAAAELLFTSLLVQAQTAMQSEAAAAPAGSRNRSRSFRSAFLVSFTHRIGQRLAEINAAVESASVAEVGDSLLPVLAQRHSVVDEAVESIFGSLVTQRIRSGHDAAGWVSGRRAADLAQLSFGDLAGASPPVAADALVGLSR